MLLGMIEELGELAEAVGGTREVPAIVDAAADFMIYAASYCNHKQWMMQELWDLRDNTMGFSILPRMADFVRTVGRVSHHHLKSEQKIRGKQEHHDAEGKKWLSYLFWNVEACLCREITDPDLPRIACDVWRTEVKPRSWEQKGEAQPTKENTEVKGGGFCEGCD